MRISSISSEMWKEFHSAIMELERLKKEKRRAQQIEHNLFVNEVRRNLKKEYALKSRATLNNRIEAKKAADDVTDRATRMAEKLLGL